MGASRPPSAPSAVKLPTASPATPDKARSPRPARLAQSRAGVNRKRLNITAHYTKQASRCAGLRLMACRCRALRVRVMVGYVSRPSPATAIPACFAASVYSGAARWVEWLPARASLSDCPSRIAPPPAALV
jgi:hypothetical protein